MCLFEPLWSGGITETIDFIGLVETGGFEPAPPLLTKEIPAVRVCPRDVETILLGFPHNPV